METINSLDEPIFSQTEMQDLVSSLHDYGTEVVVQADHTIVDYGEISTSMDLLTSGEALVEINVNDQWITVAWIKPGSIIGEIAFLDSNPRTARVIARTKCSLFRISRESFEQLSIDRPEISQNFLKRIAQILAYRLRRIEQFDAIEQGREDMRKELAADLHDQTMSELSAILMNLGLMKYTLSSDSELLNQVDEIVSMVKNADQNLRQLVKEKGHDDLALTGLDSAIVAFLQNIDLNPTKGDTEIVFKSNLGKDQLPGPVSKDIFHIVRQALLNSLKHANAYKVIISIIWNENRINFEIVDDGMGFEEDNISNVPQAGHFGLLNLKLRAERIGGNVEVNSQLGVGTSVIGSIPISRNSDKLNPEIIERKY